MEPEFPCVVFADFELGGHACLPWAFPGHKRPWAANSINPMLNLISRVLADLVKQGALARDVAALVKRLKRPEAKLATFSEKEVRQLLRHVENDRLGHAWHLALCGLRRGEISGLEWSDCQLDNDRDAGTVTIAHNRVSAGGKVHDTDPKTERSARTLPLAPALAKALKRAKALQAAERLRLGHTDPAFTMRTYVHAQNDALNAAAATLQKVVTRS